MVWLFLKPQVLHHNQKLIPLLGFGRIQISAKLNVPALLSESLAYGKVWGRTLIKKIRED
jgi:hypothetical protein